MVLQILAHAGQIVHHLDAERAQLLGGSDAGQLQELRRIDRTAGEDDLPGRRGTVSDQGQKGTQAFVQGFVPLAEMFGYINFLRSATRGRGTFTMEFDHYEEVPANLVGRERVIAATDCGLGGRVHADIAWAKLDALAQGAALASKQLWR